MTKNVANDALENVSKELATASSNQYLDLLASVLSGAIQQPTEEHRQTILSSLIVSPEEQIEQDRFLLSYKNAPFMPEDGITAIKAKAKNGKSFLCTILASSVLGCNEFGLYSYKPTAKVLYIDTEQRRYNTQRIARRVNVLLGKRPDEANPQFQAVNVSELMPDQRKAILQVLATGGYDLIIVDGIVDLCSDFNDNQVSQRLLADIIQLAHRNKVCVVNVLHIAKTSSDNQMRGHLGTELLNKCDECIQVTKKGNTYEVDFTDTKNTPVDSFAFVIDENGIPRNANDIQQELKELKEQNKIQEESNTLRIQFRELFGTSLFDYSEDNEGVERVELRKRYMTKFEVSRNTANNKIQRAKELNILSEKDGRLILINQL